MTRRAQGQRRLLWGFLVCFFGILLLCFGNLSQALGISQPEDLGPLPPSMRESFGAVFSELAPRRIGSGALEQAQGRLSPWFEARGWKVEARTTRACESRGSCGTPSNWIATWAGAKPESVLFVAHLDTVRSSPGLNDNATGVGILLAMAEYLETHPSPWTKVLLVSDGEEQGALGATAFARSGPGLEAVRAVINLDSRGRGGRTLRLGPSLQSYSWSRPSGLGSSVFDSILPYTPARTDAGPFRKLEGRRVFEVVRLGDEDFYHGARDDRASLDQVALEEQLSAARELSEEVFAADLTKLGPRPWFPTIRVRLAGGIEWVRPFFWDVLLWFGTFFLFTSVLRNLELREGLDRSTRRGAPIWVGLGFLGLGLGASLLSPWLPCGVRLDAGNPLPSWDRLSFGFGLATIWLASSASLDFSRHPFWEAWTRVWGTWFGLSSLLLFTVPSAAHVLVLPTFVAVVGALVQRLFPDQDDSPGLLLSVGVPGLAAFALGAPVGQALLLAEGTRSLVLVSFGLALLLSPLLPLVACQAEMVRLRMILGSLAWIGASSLGSWWLQPQGALPKGRILLAKLESHPLQAIYRGPQEGASPPEAWGLEEDPEFRFPWDPEPKAVYRKELPEAGAEAPSPVVQWTGVEPLEDRVVLKGNLLVGAPVGRLGFGFPPTVQPQEILFHGVPVPPEEISTWERIGAKPQPRFVSWEEPEGQILSFEWSFSRMPEGKFWVFSKQFLDSNQLREALPGLEPELLPQGEGSSRLTAHAESFPELPSSSKRDG